MSKPKPRRCAHCGNVRASISRRLCWSCRQQPGLLEQYPPRANQHGGERRGDLNVNRPPGRGTKALPGTAEKFRVLMTRAAALLPMYSPGDARREL